MESSMRDDRSVMSPERTARACVAPRCPERPRMAALATLALLALAASAQANPVGAVPIDAGAAMPSGPNVASTMPSNGALLLTDYSDSNFSLVITSPEGTTVEGSYVQVWDYYWAFRPSAALAPGQYLIESTGGPPLHQRNGLLSTTFTVLDAVDLSLPVLLSEPSLSLLIESTDTQCCDLWTELGIETGSCSTTREQAYAALEPGLSSSTGAGALGQFIFATWAPGTTAQGTYELWPPTAQGIAFATQAEEYCYEITAISIVDSTEYAYDDLEPRCVPHGDLGALATLPSELPASFFDRSRCTEPPDGLEEGWCEQNEDCEGSDAPDCVMFDHLCDDGERPGWPAGTAGGGGSDDPGSAGTSGDAGSDTERDDDPPTSSEEGCSVALEGTRTRSHAGAPWLALGLALALRRARKR
jgi:hypothetical protein